MSPVIIAVAIVVSAAVKFTEIVSKASPPTGATDALRDPTLYLIAIVLAGLGLASQYLMTLLTTNSKSKSLEAFLQHLEEKENTIPYLKSGHIY